MTKKTGAKIMYYVAVVVLLAMIFGKLLTGCGLEGDRVVRIDGLPVNDGGSCDGQPANTLRTLECKDGDSGEIVEICQSSKWSQVSNSCKSSCGEAIPTWESNIRDIVATNCAECHAGYLNYATTKTVGTTPIGGASGLSKLAYYITLPDSDSRSMPKNRPNLPQENIEQILSWIEHGLPESGTCEEDQASLSLDYLEDEVLRFLSGPGSAIAAENYRFFVVGHKDDIEAEYKALNLALNGISYANDIFLCRPIDSLGRVCAFDVTSTLHNKASFNLIERSDEVKFVSNTTKGRIIRQLTGTDQPMFHSDNFIRVVYGNQPLYYQLMGFRDFRQLIGIFGVNFDASIAAEQYKLIGTNESDISAGFNTRLNAIFEGRINGFDTACHISFDNPKLAGADRDLLQSPFLIGTPGTDKTFASEASEIICGLPNRLHAYALVNKDGVLQDFAPTDIVNCNRPDTCRDSTIDNAIDCIGCHIEGYIPMTDVVRSHVLSSRDFNNEEVRIAKKVYQEGSRNSATFNLHNSWFRQAMSAIGRTEGEDNGFIRSYNSFLGGQSIKQIASFLFISEERLVDCVNSSRDLSKLIGSVLTESKTTHDSLIQALPTIYRDCEVVQDADIQ